MKKLIFVVAVAIIAAVSCSKTYETRTSNSEGTPIILGSWADNLTKAATGRTIGGSAFAAGDYFFVYGYTSGSQTPFDGDKVSTSDATTWTYSPLRFWDRNNDYYDFYAVSPSEDTYADADDLIASHTVSTGAMTSVSLTLAGNNNDILVADKKHVLKANYGQEVQLNFRHAAALFDLKVRKGAGIGDNGVLKVTAVTLENIDKTGTFSVASYDGSTNKAAISWTGTATGSYTEANGVNAVTTISAATPITTTGDQYLINNLVVMPQTFAANAQRLKISYTITTGTGATEQVNTFTDKTYDLVLFDNTDYPTDDNDVEAGNQYNDGTKVTGWVDGVHYTYVITIDAEAIVFTATMEPWTTDNGYYYILN
ncbi:MAG: fimbrillin family protein [Bacteroidales bacterium]|nr:fimbrillin family protein [Bacteroidales bacterium]